MQQAQPLVQSPVDLLPLTHTRASGVKIGSIAFAGLWVILLVGMTLSQPNALTSEPSRPFWFAGYLIALRFAVTRPNAIFVSVQQNIVLVLWPALAALSAIWSPNPLADLYNSFQFFMTTMIGLIMVQEYGRTKILYLLFYSFLLSCFLSIAYYIAYPVEAMGWTNELRGFYHHKNEMGNYSALLMLSAISLFLGGRNRLITSFAFILGVLILISTHSGTAIVSIAAALSLVPLIILYRKSPAASSLATGFQILLFAPIFGYILLSGVDFFDYALGSIGKDSTLTGRTVLWQFAADAIAKSPFIGYGYKGWWDDSNPVVFFLRYVIGQDLWYFHNVYLEVTVSFGALGALLLLVTLVAAYRRVLIGFWKHPDSVTIWSTLYLIFVTIYSTAENALFVNHSVDYLILVVVFASNVPAVRSRAKDARAFANQPDYGRAHLLST